ncbi:unnamed protein product [Echinostoma caproni]|uniref:Granulin n=1 Tax=Echinostoma caproni TaxID=27848 RepID=A0A183ADX4_9TREM|nr:unnamed protein product [Echinostoma caproni]
MATRTSPAPSVAFDVERHSKTTAVSTVCPGGRMECPKNSTCCQMTDAQWGCCPSLNAVCCSDGTHCCPEGYLCSSVDSSCIREPTNEPVKEPVNVPGPQDNVCPDKRSFCIDHQTCCLLIDGDFGCCPLTNGTCCEDRRHCCPEGTMCAEEPGECIRPAARGLHANRVTARRMLPVPESVSFSSKSIPNMFLRSFTPGQVIRTGWCSECGDNGYCCPDAHGLHNRMCCDKAGSMCCPDGQHCCPPGTKCAGNGQCDQITEDRFLAPFLVASKRLGSGNTRSQSKKSEKSRPALLDPRLL